MTRNWQCLVKNGPISLGFLLLPAKPGLQRAALNVMVWNFFCLFSTDISECEVSSEDSFVKPQFHIECFPPQEIQPPFRADWLARSMASWRAARRFSAPRLARVARRCWPSANDLQHSMHRNLRMSKLWRWAMLNWSPFGAQWFSMKVWATAKDKPWSMAF